MTDKLKQIIKEEVAKLPKETQDAINAFDWASVVENIGKKYLLDESEINDLQVETLLILVGLEDGSYFAQNIENNVITTKDESEKIAEEVGQKVFTPIYNSVMENIKKDLKDRKIDPQQNVNFILSGGDYSVFLQQARQASDVNTTETDEAYALTNSKRIEELKNKFLFDDKK